MDGEEQEASNTRANSVYRPQMVDASIMKYRLDTKPTLDAIQVYLEGSVEFSGVDESGNPQIMRHKLSEPRMSQEGIHSVMSKVRAIISAPVVQGNFVDMGRYDNYVKEANEAIAWALGVNATLWEIKDEDLEPICDTIMLLIQPFLSRLIFNKERDGYMGTMMTSETTVQKESGGLFSKLRRR